MTLLEATSGAGRPSEEEESPYLAAAGARGGSRGRTGTKPDWSRPGTEPSLEDVLEDPIVHLVMRRDRLTPNDYRHGHSGTLEDATRTSSRPV